MTTQDKATSLNLEQQTAVSKLRSFLNTPSTLIVRDTVIEQKDLADFILGKELGERLVLLKDYVIKNSFLVTGPGGSGKTYTSEVGVDGIKVDYCAPTDQACGVLRENTKTNIVYTMASVLGTSRLDKVTNDQQSDAFYLRSKEAILKDMDRGLPVPLVFTTKILLIDEASMIGGDGKMPKTIKVKEDKVTKDVMLSNDSFVALLLRLSDRLELDWGIPNKFIFLGDYAQTPPVGTEGDDDAFLLSTLMKNEDNYAALETIMRTDIPDIKNLLTLYRKEIDRLNTLRIEHKKDSTHTDASPNITIIPFTERVNSERIYYYNQEADFLRQFTYLYNNRVPNQERNPNYISIINFNNEVHNRTVTMVKALRTFLFGDPSIKYYNNETLLTKSTLTITDKLTGRENTLRKDSRVFVIKVEDGVMNKVIGKTFRVSIKLPKLTIRCLIDGDWHTEVLYAASKYHIDTIANIRGGNRYNAGRMSLTPEEVEYFGLHSMVVSLPYSAWIELQNLVPDFGYAYVINNFKIQGASLQYSMVDEGNILGCRAFPKKKLQYVYTALSRGRQGLFIFNPNNVTNTPELVSFNSSAEQSVQDIEEVDVDLEVPF